MESQELLVENIKVPAEQIDEDGFVTLWKVASSTVDGDIPQTRDLASRLLGFLCKHKCNFVVASSTDINYLEEWFERDNKLLYDWKPVSEMVDVVSQHVSVPYAAFSSFIRSHKFKPTTAYAPKRADRVAWFTDDWNVG
ncbi:MAG: hypothetical protein ACI9HK_000494 [Pirellulaceae bacterium]|jgi:hypothetical protein